MKPFVLATIGNRLYYEYVISLQALQGLPYEYVVADGFDPVNQLYTIVKGCKGVGAPARTSGILFIEQDHAFTVADIKTLLEFAEAHPRAVCGGLYGARRLPGRVVGTRLEKVSESPPAWTSDMLGFGFLYTPWSVYEELHEPWFNSVWDDRDGKFRRVNPDEFLSLCCRGAGIPLFAVELPTLTHAFEPGQQPLPRFRGDPNDLSKVIGRQIE